LPDDVDVSVIGNGPGTTEVFLASGTDANVFSVGDTTNTGRYHFEGFRINGNKANNSSGDGIDVNSRAVRLMIKDVIVQDCAGVGFDINRVGGATDPGQWSLIGCDAINGASDGFQLSASTPDDNTVATFNGCYSHSNDGHGFNMTTAQSIAVNCIASSNTNGFDIGSGNHSLVGCKAFNNSENGLHTDASINRDLELVGCSFDSYEQFRLIQLALSWIFTDPAVQVALVGNNLSL